MRFRVSDFDDIVSARWKRVDTTAVDHWIDRTELEKVDEWLKGPKEVAKTMLSASVTNSLYQWARVFRNTVRNPAIGLPQSLPLDAYEKTLSWSSDRYSLITDPDQLSSFLTRDDKKAIDSFLATAQGEIAMIRWPELIAELGKTQWGACVSGLGQAVPFVGRAVQGFMAAVSFIDEVQRAGKEEQKRALTSINSGVRAIGQTNSSSLFDLDRLFSEEVFEKCGAAIPSSANSFTQQDIDDFAGGGGGKRNLTRAFLPGPIPGSNTSEYFVGNVNKSTTDQASLILGLEDYSEPDDPMRVACSVLADGRLG